MLRASAGSILFTSVYECTSSTAPYSYLLEIDGVRILLDCGWDDGFSPIYLSKLKPYLPTVHAVLLSSPHLCSCGALPYVLQHIQPGTLVAAAGSTSKMSVHGLLHPFLYQFPNSQTFTLEDGESFVLTVDSIYSAFRSVREPYGGKVVAKHGDVEVVCQAIFAGRMLGGYGWTVKYQIDELFYCPDFSMKPSYALKRFNVPTAANILFLSSFPFQRSTASSGVAKKYEEQLDALFKDIQHTLRGGSDVLLPVTVAGRGLETLNTIVHLLTERGGDKYKVVLACTQAQELMDKAATMTEALQDDLILGDQRLFSTVIACRNAEEVVAVAGPKICVADGASMNYGVSAELIEYFLQANDEGGNNLIVFTEPQQPSSNADAIAKASDGEAMNLVITRRTRLSREELEDYYIQIEHEIEEKRKELDEERAMQLVQEQENPSSDGDSDGDEVPSEATRGGPGGADTQGAARLSKSGKHGNAANPKAPLTTPGLVLPPFMYYHSKHLSFPTLDSTDTLNAALRKQIDISYGLPVSDEEQMVMQKRAPARLQSDAGPEALLVENDVQREANVPSKVLHHTIRCQRHCRVITSDLTGFPDAVTMKGMLRSKWTFAKKVVCLRGRPEEGRLFHNFCRTEKSMKCGENVFPFLAVGSPLELATHVYSYAVQLDAELAHTLPRNLRRVRESKSKSMWEVGWVNGELRGVVAADKSEEPEVQRMRREAATYSLAAVSGSKAHDCAELREENSLQSGSFFVGDVDLLRLKDITRREYGLYSEFHKKAPLLVFDDGVCVRKGADGTVTISSIATPAMFELRRTIYRQYAQTL